MDTGIEVFTARFEGASESEGGLEGTIGDRYIGGYLGALFDWSMPLFGYGIGLGTNVGATLMGGDMWSFGFNGEVEWSRIMGECGIIFGFNGEVEWSRIMGECGIILGLIIIGIRVLFSLKLWKKAYDLLVKRYDLLPWMLSAGMMLTIPQGQWSTPTNLGFSILLGGLTLAAVRTSGSECKE